MCVCVHTFLNVSVCHYTHMKIILIAIALKKNRHNQLQLRTCAYDNEEWTKKQQQQKSIQNKYHFYRYIPIEFRRR